MRSTARIVAVLACVAALAACQTSTERAEEHYSNATTLIEEGKPRRAIIELRNAVRLNQYFTEAREDLAALLEEQKLMGQALAQFRTLVDQDPANLTGLRGVARISLQQGEFGRAGNAAKMGLELQPNDTELLTIAIAVRYRDSLVGQDNQTRRTVGQEAVELRDRTGGTRLLAGIIIDNYVRDGEDLAALDEVEKALEFDPNNLALYQVNLEILLRRGEFERVETELRRMLIRFPENTNVKESLIRYYISRGQLDDAESFLRDQIVEGEPADATRVTLVRFLAEGRSRDVAREELERLIVEGTNTPLFRSMRATMNYEDGFQQQAITELEEVVASEEPSDQRREIQVLLARMLDETGNEVGARAMIEGVLETDPTSVEALKVMASWKIDEDNTDDAIINLRTALDQEPNDHTVMTIMARAHLLNGERDLAGEMLALAVQASQSSKEESLRYARFLASDGRLLPAESVLIDALRITPRDADILTELASLYVEMDDWPRAQQVEREMRNIGTERTIAVANEVRLAMLQAQNRETELTTFLTELTQNNASGPNIGAEIALLRSHIDRGDLPLARNYLDELLGERPDDQVLRFLDGALQATTGDHDAALEIYRGLLVEEPGAERVWIEIARSLNALGRKQEADRTIDDALAAVPNSATLLWMKASLLEEEGDYEGALSVYERLYDADNSTSIIANNLASLLSTLRDDAESLSRAYQIARRLRDSEFAPFQDTYGWIAYRRGDYREALRHLEPAAAALIEDPLVQFHLARTQQALGNNVDALAQYRLAISLAEEQGDRRPQFDIAREQVEVLLSQ